MTNAAYQHIRRKTKATMPAVRLNLANILRALRRGFSRPGFMEPNAVPGCIKAMATHLSPVSHLLNPSTRLR